MALIVMGAVGVDEHVLQGGGMVQEVSMGQGKLLG